MKIFLAILCLFTFQNFFGQTGTIKIARDTVFNIEDFVNFKGEDTAKSLSFIKDKYFRPSGILKSLLKKPVCGDVDITPLILIGKNFNCDFCIWETGIVYSIELTINQPDFLKESTVAKQLQTLGFVKDENKKKKGIVITKYSRQDKHSGKYIIIHSYKKKVRSISIY